MAEHVLIDGYLAQFRQTLSDVERPQLFVDEVADHLLERVDQYVETGVELLRAQRRALAEFGDPLTVGREFASVNVGGASVPTSFTRIAGRIGVAAGIGFVIAVLALFSSDLIGRTWSQQVSDGTFFLFVAFLPLSLLGSAIYAVGITQRFGRPRAGWVGAGLIALGAVGAAVQIFWILWTWLAPLFAGLVVLAWVFKRRWLALAALGATGMAVIAALESFSVVNGDSLVFQLAVSGAFALCGLSISQDARELASETPVDHPSGLIAA